MTNDTCGPTSPRQFALYDRDTSSWRTYPATGLWGSIPFSEIWPEAGMTRSGAAFELAMSALRTDASDCSALLPTPVVTDATNTRNCTAWRSNQGAPGAHTGATLTDFLWMLFGYSQPRGRQTASAPGVTATEDSILELLLPSVPEPLSGSNISLRLPDGNH